MQAIQAKSNNASHTKRYKRKQRQKGQETERRKKGEEAEENKKNTPPSFLHFAEPQERFGPKTQKCKVQHS